MSVSPVMVTLPPLAVSVPDCDALIPTVTLAKLPKVAGEMASTGTVAKFTPVFAAFEIVICWLAGLKV